MQLLRNAIWAAFTGTLLFVPAAAQNLCTNFPSGSIPFSSIAYVTAGNSVGDHLVVGSLAGLSVLNAIPLPASTNQQFCDAQVQLAPQQFYPSVYVPTAAERSGNFSAFAGLLVNPTNGQAYPNGVIPASQLGSVFAWRIGPAFSPAAVRGWSPTGSMTVPRLGPGAVLLPSGKVLLTGYDQQAVDFFDPSSGTFSPAGTLLAAHGESSTVTLLNDGRILIVGGRTQPGVAELFDPSSGKSVSAGIMLQFHGAFHTAILLNDGRVLIVGGLAQPGNAGDPTVSNAGAEIFDPVKGVFTKAGTMAINRNGHTATVMADGRVLIAGGTINGGSVFTNTAEVFDPQAGTFSQTSGLMQSVRGQFFAVLLPSNKVLLGGGYGDSGTAELFDPPTGRFTFAGSMTLPRPVSTAVLLPSGQVLVAGGYYNYPAATSSAELYNPATGTFSVTGNMTLPRGGHTATVLFDGRVLVTGGTSVCCSTILTSAELYTPVNEGLLTSQSGLTFRSAPGTSPLSQTVAVLSPTAAIPWTVSVRTYGGGAWLSATPPSGTSSPGSASSTIAITVNPSGLAAQDYYGVVTVTPTDGTHPPVSISIVFSIVPAGTTAPPGVQPSGLVFLGAPGSTPKSQSFAISNVTSQSLFFSGVASETPVWFDFNPKSGNVGAGQATSITVTPSTTGLASGVYRGSIKLSFGDGSSQSVDLLLVISSTAGSLAAPLEPRATSPPCMPSKLLPVFTTLGTGFVTVAGWPNAIQVQIVDDCGSSANSGNAIVSFSNGDPAVSLLSLGTGNWTGTWAPLHNSTGVSARVDALEAPLTGSAQVNGQVSLNAAVPILGSGGIVSSGDYASSPALGLLVSIFGAGLADAASSASTLPLPTHLGSTSVTMSGLPVPMLYASPTQVNVIIPYNLSVNAPYQLIVQRGNAISVPAPIGVFDAEPAILSTAGNGAGQGHIYKVDASGKAFLADASAPATAGDYLVIYAVGLGAVAAPVTAGDAAPSSPLSTTTAPVIVTIGGVSAPVGFAGLTPGFAGLYQVNVMVPAGIAPGNQTPVTLGVSGKSSPDNIVMAIQ